MKRLMKWVVFLVIIALVAMPFNVVFADDESVFVTSCNITEGATVPSDAWITLGYNANIQPSSQWGSIEVTCGGTPQNISTSYTDDTLYISPNNPDGKWDNGVGAAYVLTVPADAVQDYDNNPAASYTLTFNTEADTTAPTLDNSDPANGATDVAIDQTIQLSFSEDIHLEGLADSGSFPGNSGDPITVMRGSTYIPSDYSISDNTLELSGTWGSADGSVITVTVKDGAVKDTATTPNYTSSDITVTFNLTDTTAPTLSSSTPANGAVNVAVSQPISIVFSEPITLSDGSTDKDFSGMSGDSITVQRGSTYIGSHCSISDNTLTLTPTSAWGPADGSAITVTVKTGSVIDTAAPSNSNASSITVTFSLTDTTAPTLSSSTPANGATGVSASQTISLVFSENVLLFDGSSSGDLTGTSSDKITVKRGSTYYSSHYSISGKTIQLTGTWGSPDGSAITVTVTTGAVIDTATPANANASPYTVNFSLIAAPTLTSSNPADGDTNLSTSTTINLIFSKNIRFYDNTTSGNLSGSSSDKITIQKGSTYLSFHYNIISGNTLQLSGTWASNYDGSTITVTVKTGAVAEATQLSNVNTVQYTRIYRLLDYVSPSVSSSDPTSGTTGLANNKALTITYSEPIQQGSYWSNISVTRGTTQIAINKEIINNNTLCITPTSVWDTGAGGNYVLSVPYGAIKDMNNNGNQYSYSLQFSTKHTIAPVVTGVTPANGATGQAANVTVSVTYDETVKGSNLSAISATCNGTPVGLSYSVSGTKLIINNPSGWAYASTYQINIPAGAVADTSDNAAPAVTLAFSTMQRPVALIITKRSATTILSGKGVTLNYTIDKKSNVQLNVLDAAGNVVKTVLKTNVKPGKGSIAWTSGKKQYGSYTLRLVATPIDASTNSPCSADTPVTILAKADVVITQCPKSWDIWHADFLVYYTVNTSCSATCTLTCKNYRHVFSFSLTPYGEGLTTPGLYFWTGEPYMPSGTYKFTITVNNPLGKDSATKTVKVINNGY